MQLQEGDLTRCSYAYFFEQQTTEKIANAEVFTQIINSKL